jgi:hypothetical protein
MAAKILRPTVNRIVRFFREKVMGYRPIAFFV